VEKEILKNTLKQYMKIKSLLNAICVVKHLDNKAIFSGILKQCMKI
jgi:hypothetical protein